jgi:hypothetical protein
VAEWIVHESPSVYNSRFGILFPVSELKFVQPVRRNLLAPVLIAFVVLGIAIALLLRYTPHSIAKLTVLKTSIYPTHTVYKGQSILVGRDQAQDDLYVLTTVRIEDRLNLPLFIKDLTGTLVTADGEKIETSAVQKGDLENLYTAFPSLRTLASEPLVRETLIDQGKSAEGMVILRFPVTKAVWDKRGSATLNIVLYHQGPISIKIPRSSASTSSSEESTAP